MNIPILQKGFRPFFFLTAIFAALWIPLWSYRYTHGWTSDWLGSMWHAHEMLFGFFGAMIAGFLLTAVEKWTGKKTVGPAGLFALVVLWMAGRVAMVQGEATLSAGLIDTLFFPALAFVIARPIVSTGNRRNFVVVAILFILGGANLASHLGTLGLVEYPVRSTLMLATFTVVALVVLIGGRVIPFFTSRAIGKKTESNQVVEKAIVPALLGLIVCEALSFDHGVAAFSLILGVLLLVRMRGWRTAASIKIPILFVLHVGHLWLAIGFLACAIAPLWSALPASLGLHLITVGGMSMIGLGMMARVALGHTGRPIVAPKVIVAAFAVLALAAIVRTVAPVMFPMGYVDIIVAASLAWSVAFGLYTLRYLPILWSPRADGRPG